MKTEFPTITAGSYGKGKVVYFANQTDALSFLNGHEDYTEIYKNAINNVLATPFEVRSDAPRSVHINIIEDSDHNNMVAALVNLTGTSQRPLKEVVAVPGFTIYVNRPGYTFKGLKNLWDSADVSAESVDGGVRIKVDSLKEFKSIELEWISDENL